MSVLFDKVVLITGGTGSFGQAFIDRVLRAHQVRKLIILSRDECKQWQMQQNTQFASERVRYFLGDVRDERRLRRAFEGVDVVIHAAALKQVVTAEYNPSECVKTNVMGAINVIEAAIDAGVQKVIALSTDKAVNPANLYGATKLCADKLFVAGNVYVGARGYPRFSVVRYGNVLGSRGSVLDHWARLIKEGARNLPVTDERMTRFWITVEDAVDFVIASLAQMKGGEVFVPKCPSMRVVDLIEAVAPGMPTQIQGIRPGEKLHETLIALEDGERTVEQDGHYVIYSTPQACAVGAGFIYSSDRNTQWLGADTLRGLVKNFSVRYTASNDASRGHWT